MSQNLELIKSKIKSLYLNNSLIHINLSTKRSKTHLQKISATIIGVYPNIFTVEENEAGIKKRYNFSYVDILTGTVGIAELETMTETAH